MSAIVDTYPIVLSGLAPGGVSLVKHSNGPDQTDVEILMRAIEQTHGGLVKLTVSPAGIGPGGGMVMVLSFEVAAVVGPTAEDQTLVVNRWPCPMHRDFWSCIFEGLYRLDGVIGRQYNQLPMPEG